MRIIAGSLKGRVVKMPKSDKVRPTTDKTKESLFNYLQNYIGFDDIKVCDIYAGSGSLGLEALSRGASEVHFVEKDFSVYKNLENTINLFKVDKQCHIYKMNAVQFSKMENHSSYDLILADPPFFKNDIHEVVPNILNNNFLNQDGIFLIERSIQTKEIDIENFKIEPFKQIGDSLIYKWEL